MAQTELRFFLNLELIGNSWKLRDFPAEFVISVKKLGDLAAQFPWFHGAAMG